MPDALQGRVVYLVLAVITVKSIAGAIVEGQNGKFPRY